MKPTVGRIVLYTLSHNDALAINSRRNDYVHYRNADRQHRVATGYVAHHGNPVHQGDVLPMVIIRVWHQAEPLKVNGQVLLDGNDHYWAPSREEGDEPGTWAWPKREES